MTFKEMLEKVPAESRENVEEALRYVLEFIADNDYRNVNIHVEALGLEEEEKETERVWH